MRHVLKRHKICILGGTQDPNMQPSVYQDTGQNKAMRNKKKTSVFTKNQRIRRARSSTEIVSRGFSAWLNRTGLSAKEDKRGG